MYCVQQAANPAMSPHRGVSPRSPKGPGAFGNIIAAMAGYSMRTRTHGVKNNKKNIIPSRSTPQP